MLPSRGCCHAVLLLTYSARLKSPTNLAHWVASARTRATMMAAALNLDAVARGLVALNLAEVASDRIRIFRGLQALSERADTETFSQIARILLERAPPPWLRVAVSDTGVAREYIPADDLAALEWHPNLDALLMEVLAALQAGSEIELRKRLGDAAELLVVAALRRAGGQVTHVALLSDGYGYDVEHVCGDRVQRIEVKAATPRTADHFFLSRNEYDKSQALAEDWRLVQVILSPAALVVPDIGASNVLEIRELRPADLASLAPSDTDHFRWEGTAMMTPPAQLWARSKLQLDPAVRVPGVRRAPRS